MKKVQIFSLFLLCFDLFAESSFVKFNHNGKGLIKFVSVETEIREYDAQGNLISEETPFKKLKYEYDLNGNQIYAFESYTIGGDNEIFRKFDNNNNLIYEKGSASGEHIFQYDENQNLISKKNLVNGTVDFEIAYTYDSNNNLIKSESSNGYTFFYEYDDCNNLIHYYDLGSAALFCYNSYFNEGEDFLIGNEITALAVPVFFFGLIKLFKTRFKKTGKSSLKRVKNENQDLIAGAFENDPKSEKKLLQALNHYNVEEYDKSIKILEELLYECNITNDRHILNLFLAMNYKQIGETSKAINLYESLIALGNANGRIYSNLGTIYVQEGNLKRGIELCKKAVTFDNKNPHSYYNVACGYFKDGDFESAIQWAKNTLEVNSNFQEAIALLYLIYTILEQPEDVKKYEQKAIANGISKSQLKRIVRRYV